MYDYRLSERRRRYVRSCLRGGWKEPFATRQSAVVSLGGFPAPRAGKYLKEKLFHFNPHYIVIQFGSTDASCPIRAKSRAASRHFRHGADGDFKPCAALSAAAHRSQQISLLSPVRWEIASLIGYLLKIAPVTPLPLYVAAIDRMVESCLAEGITPVLLSPFIYGPRYTTGRAISYTNALRELSLGKKDIVFVDCFRLLENYPKSLILLHDGFHLSPLAQKLVGEEIGQAIVADIAAKKADGNSGSSSSLDERAA